MSSINEELFEQAKKSMPGGVNSPVRAFKSVNMVPRFINRAKGSKIIDVEGNEYIDYVGSWGAMILGHANDQVISAVKLMCDKGTSYGAPTSIEIDLAEMVISLVPSIEMIRMVNSGSEATMGAVRLARGYTKRDKIIKFEGCYHGAMDPFLIKAGSGALTFGSPDSSGVTQGIANDTLIAQYNHIDSVKSLIRNNKNQIACVIIEPICGNMGCILPKEGFLKELRDICSNEGILLIFDEVITGFRVSKGGAQELYNIRPDLTCLGKIIGGGFPVGAYGGRKEIMEHVSPLGSVYQAGTLSGNPIAMIAGLETLRILNQNNNYKKIEQLSMLLDEGIQENIKKLNIKLSLNKISSLSSIFFTEHPVVDYNSAKSSNTEIFTKYFHEMIRQNIYIAPSQFEVGFVSLSHTEQDIQDTIKANYNALKKVFNK